MPCADEVWRLQNDDDPECRFFRRMVRGTDAPSRGTLQGIYVCAPNGERLGGLNSLNPDHVATMLERALQRWRELPDAARRLPDDAQIRSRHRWEDSFPEGGLVLTRVARDLPPDGDPGAEPRRPFNQDRVWFTEDEARGFLPDRLDVEVGTEHDVPRALVDRLARLALVDNVRGQTIPFAPSEVAGSRLRATVVARDGDRVEIELDGETHAAADAWLLGDNYWKPHRTWPHGVRTRVVGRAAYDLDAGAFTAFELVAVGVRWGRTVNNGRGRGDALEPSGIGFWMTLTPPDEPGRRVAPTFINVYDADWVRHSGD